jgi:nicotinamide-nucleotide amidase
MIKEIVEILKNKKATITFAESCTGGRVASAFTAVSGVSEVFNGSVVSYSNEIKSLWLGVREQTLMEHGAVSRECVSEMLDGALKLARADYAIAISGIAGPSGGTPEKPVGTVFIGVKGRGRMKIERFLFSGDRESIQNQSVESAILLFKNIL